jgi:hypothetical protein
MSTVIVMWAEKLDPAFVESRLKPIGTAESVDAAKEWCQWQANQLAQDVLDPLEWKHYLSRGTPFATSHYTTMSTKFGVFEIWTVGTIDK